MPSVGCCTKRAAPASWSGTGSWLDQPGCAAGSTLSIARRLAARRYGGEIMVTVRPLEQTDHADWRRLWTAYLEFYNTTVSEEVYATTWHRLIHRRRIRAKRADRADRRQAGRTDPLPLSPHLLVAGQQLLSAGSLRRPGDTRQGRRPGAHRGRAGGRRQARHRQRLLDDPRNQRHRPQALRQRGEKDGVHRV